MFSHTLKGYTIGYLLTRRAFRLIFGFPGFLIDALIIAPLATFGNAHYLDFWKDCNWASYVDGTTQSGFFQPIFAYPGDFIGTVLGAIGGTILGSVLYIPDAILRIIAFTYEFVSEALSTLANNIGKIFGKDLPVFINPTFAEKAWNISAVTLGFVLAAPLYLAAKAIEFVLPIGNGLSQLFLICGSCLGGIVGTVALLPLLPVIHLGSKAVELFRGFRESVRSLSAFIYAKTNALSWTRYNEYTNNGASEAFFTTDPHSTEFRNKLTEYKAKSTIAIIFGLNVAPQQIVPAAAAVVPLEYAPNPKLMPTSSNDNDFQPGAGDTAASAPPESKRIGEEDHVTGEQYHEGITYQYHGTPR